MTRGMNEKCVQQKHITVLTSSHITVLTSSHIAVLMSSPVLRVTAVLQQMAYRAFQKVTGVLVRQLVFVAQNLLHQPHLVIHLGDPEGENQRIL